MDRVFLDANVLYSAAWRPTLTGLRLLWTLDGVTLMTSTYAISEADRNIVTPEHRASLDELVRPLTLVEQQGRKALPPNVQLPAKDWPILLAAIEGGATHLLTGDRRHFGRYFGQTLEGVLVSLPASYSERASASDAGERLRDDNFRSPPRMTSRVKLCRDTRRVPAGWPDL